MSKAVVRNRNYTLDFIKLIASYFVVFIHISFSGLFGELVEDIARFAVPMFFMISGFFAYGNDNAKLKAKAINIFKLYLFSAVIYHIRDIIWLIKDEGVAEGVSQYIARVTDINNILGAVFLNDVITSTQIWYLLALLYVYFLQMLLNKIKMSDKGMFIIATVLLCVHIFLREGLLIFGFSIPSEYIRNFLLTGYPFFGLGMMVRKHSLSICNMPTIYSVIMLVAGIALTLLSHYLIGTSELYIGSVIIAVALIALALRYPDIKIAHKMHPLTQTSTYIYVFHILVYNVVNMIVPYVLNISTDSLWYINLMPVCICVLTTAFSYMYIKLKSTFLRKNVA